MIEWIKSLWRTLSIYGVEERFVEAAQAFCRNGRACVKLNGKLNEEFLLMLVSP